MVNNRKIPYIKYALLVVNILSLYYLSFLIYFTTNKVCARYVAREFISRISAVPINPSKLLCLTHILVLLLISSFITREFLIKNMNSIIYLSLFFDLCFSIILMFLTNFNYNCILFWFFANIIFYVQDKVKMFFMSLAIVLYVCTDYEFLHIKYQLFSIGEYISIYNAHAQQYLMGVYNVLMSLNVIIFILLCVYLIQAQRGIIEQVNCLYRELTQKNRELEYANEELKQYADMKEKMGETKERNRLAREIHDTLGHTLTGISAAIDACLTMIEHNPRETKERLEMVSDVTRYGIEEVRRSVSELHPDAIERLSLEKSIQSMIKRMMSITQAEIEFCCETDNLKFEEDEENTIYRIIQESITNAVRHGKAKKIWVHVYKENNNLLIKIRDNGVGCEHIKEGFGTKHMLERAKILHGTVTFDGTNGFLVEAVIPIRWGEDYD